MGFVARFAPEQSAHVYAALGKPAKADVAIRVQVDFQVCAEHYVCGVRFESIPLKALCLGLGTPASGLNEGFVVERFLVARVHTQLASVATERVGKPGVKVES
jgi:hypothetical protein